MSATIVRLILSVLIIAGSPAVYAATFIILIETAFGWRSEDAALLLTGAVTCMLLAAAWSLNWGGTVKWTRRRVAHTGWVVLGSGFVSLLVGAAFGLIDEEVGLFFGSVAWALAWLTGSTLAWRETTTERGQRLRHLGIRAIACPKCGYNMTGLKQSVCPECGASYTLDELFAALREEKGTLPEETRV